MKLTRSQITAAEILGNPDYLAISYGGYRAKKRSIQPTVEMLKEDMKILNAMGIKIIRTYNVQLPHAANILKAIDQLNQEDDDFEMYMMLGAWIDCKNAWTGVEPDHERESEQNAGEIERAVELANQYPDIVKIIAVGNESMVKWAGAYYVQPWVVLKWVNHLQDLKANEKLNKDVWITSSDNFAAWGGGLDLYRVEALTDLIKAVDYISMHTYPMHDTHYNPTFWGMKDGENQLSQKDQIDSLMNRSVNYAISQYESVKANMESLGLDKPIHIGETGWATYDNGFYGNEGSSACDQYKSGIYYKKMRQWTNQRGMSCFYFEAFDEPWKDGQNEGGSENHFGLFSVDGEAKYALWDLVDQGNFYELSRGGKPIRKSYNGNEEALLKHIVVPSIKEKILIQ